MEPGTAVPLLDADRVAAGREAFLAPADFEGLLAADAVRLAAAFGALVDFFALVFAIIQIHLSGIVLKQPTTIRGVAQHAFRIQTT